MGKTSAIVRIILWGFVALLLTALLVLGLMGMLDGLFHADGTISLGSNTISYANADRYTVGGGSVNAKDVRAVDIDWVSGSVSIAPGGSKTKIIFSETGAGDSESDQMRYWLDNGILRIRYCAPRKALFGNISTPSKALTVELPAAIAHLADVTVETASAEITASDFSANTIDLMSVSGKIDVRGLICEELELESVSGEITADSFETGELSGTTVSGDSNVSGKMREVNWECVSGDATIRADETLHSADCEGVSGEITLYLPENSGFTAEHEAASGDFHCDFAVIPDGDRITYKDGGIKLQFESVSGDVKLKKAK